MPLDATDLGAIWLTVKLASLTTLILLMVGTPIAWWLARTGSWLRGPVGALVALPLVLPPTVIGFYLLLAMGPEGWVGQLTEALGLGRLPFTFAGLVVGSLCYSLPFVVQPLQNAFEAIGPRPLEAAATLRASPLDTFFHVVLPLARPGFVTAAILLVLGTPIAWWLARTRSWLRGPIGAVVALPLVLPPTVIGFYLLLALGPHGWIGQATQALGLGSVVFSFTGLVIGSVVYSMPFVVQPLQNAFGAIGQRPLEVAATLRASPWDTFVHVVLPLARPGFITASILGFAHTVGEFGVVLMIGGNIPDKTRVVSVQIFDHVEAMEYSQAHWLAGAMLMFSFLVLLMLYAGRRGKAGWS